MKKLAKRKISKSKTKSSRISKRNPETIEEQLKQLENLTVTIIVWDAKLSAPRAQLEGPLVKVNYDSNIYLWGIVKHGTSGNYENIVFNIKEDDVHIKHSRLIKEISILINFPKTFFEAKF